MKLSTAVCTLRSHSNSRDRTHTPRTARMARHTLSTHAPSAVTPTTLAVALLPRPPLNPRITSTQLPSVLAIRPPFVRTMQMDRTPPLSQPGTVGYWAAPHGRQRQSKEAGHGDEAGAYDHLRQVSESSYDEPNYGVVNPPTVADTAASYDDVISGTAVTPVYHSPAPATVDQHGYDLMSECRERHRAMARSRSRSRNDTYNAAVDLGESSDDSDHGGGSDRAYGERYDGEGAEPAPGAHAGNPANESTTHDGGSVTETYAVAKSVAVTHSNIGTDADAYDEVSAAGAGPAPVYHTQPADEQGCRMAATLGGIVTSPTALSLTEHQHGYDVIPDVKNSSPAGDSDEIYTEIDASKEDAPVYDVIRFIPAANGAEPQYASPGQGSNDVSGV